MTHPELDRLADHCFRFAKTILAKNNEFWPFAYGVRLGGALIPIALNAQEAGRSAQVHAEELAAGLRLLANQKQVSAIALCTNNRISLDEEAGQHDAIVVGLEHLNGESVDVLLPYRKRMLPGYSFGEMMAQERTRSWFVQESPK
jgi:hypothetical protein